MRVLRDGGRAVASLAMLPLGLWFGGRRVPAVGVGNVAVLPHYRGRSLARELLDHVAAERAALGDAFIILYSATLPVYRRAGFEPSGWRFRWSADPGDFAGAKAPPPMIMSDEQTLATIRALQTEAGRRSAGMVDRSETLWGRKAHPYRMTVDPYVLPGRSGAPGGYALLHHKDLRLLEVKDWVALDSTAAAGIASLIASTRSTTTEVIWDGGPDDALQRVMDVQSAKVEYVRQWLLRPISPARALATRGLPRGGDLTIAVEGFAPVALGAGGPVLTCHGRGFGPLFTGQRTPEELAAFGLVEGDEEALTRATATFAGPIPCMTDEF
jgi:predicted acetyltransferase